MENINKAIDMMIEEIKRQEGEDFEFEVGEEMSAVFNDGLIVVSFNEDGVDIKVIAEKPMEFDFSLDIVEERLE